MTMPRPTISRNEATGIRESDGGAPAAASAASSRDSPVSRDPENSSEDRSEKPTAVNDSRDASAPSPASTTPGCDTETSRRSGSRPPESIRPAPRSPGLIQGRLDEAVLSISPVGSAHGWSRGSHPPTRPREAGLPRPGTRHGRSRKDCQRTAIPGVDAESGGPVQRVERTAPGGRVQAESAAESPFPGSGVCLGGGSAQPDVARRNGSGWSMDAAYTRGRSRWPRSPDPQTPEGARVPDRPLWLAPTSRPAHPAHPKRRATAAGTVPPAPGRRTASRVPAIRPSPSTRRVSPSRSTPSTR